MSLLRCPVCSAVRPMPDNDVVWVRCPECLGVLFRPSAGPKVLIAHESDRVAQQIGVLLLESGFSPVCAPSGQQALGILAAERPRAVVLDVGLSDVRSFQLVEYLRRHASLGPIKVILVASVFNKTAYKRRPSSLYGADDYVEQHHIPDKLPAKLRGLLGVQTSAAGGARQPFEPLSNRELHGELSGLDRARALARSIVADIALYNGVELQAYLRTRDLATLAPSLTEGRKLLAEMADPTVYSGKDPILDAFRALVAEMERS